MWEGNEEMWSANDCVSSSAVSLSLSKFVTAQPYIPLTFYLPAGFFFFCHILTI